MGYHRGVFFMTLRQPDAFDGLAVGLHDMFSEGVMKPGI